MIGTWTAIQTRQEGLPAESETFEEIITHPKRRIESRDAQIRWCGEDAHVLVGHLINSRPLYFSYQSIHLLFSHPLRHLHDLHRESLERTLIDLQHVRSNPIWYTLA